MNLDIIVFAQGHPPSLNYPFADRKCLVGCSVRIVSMHLEKSESDDWEDCLARFLEGHSTSCTLLVLAPLVVVVWSVLAATVADALTLPSQAGQSDDLH